MPKIEGLPATRPVCAYCRRPARALAHDIRDEQHRVIRRQFARWQTMYAGLFCRLVCAKHFAAAAHEAGIRISGDAKTYRIEALPTGRS